MSEFYTKAAFLDKTGLYTKYSSIALAIDKEGRKIDSVIGTLRQYSGFDIEIQISNLEKYRRQLSSLWDDVRQEWNTIEKIIDIINDKEIKAAGILGSAAAIEHKDYSYSEEDTIKITHEDWGKLVNQFKYYSTRNDATKRFYEWLKKFYSLNTDTDLTQEDYDMLKNLYNTLTHVDDGAAYVYSNVEWCYEDVDGNLGWKNNLDFGADGSYDTGIMRYTQAYGYDGDTSEWTITIGTVGGSIGVSAEALSSLTEKDFNYLKAKLVDGKFNLEDKKDKDSLKVVFAKMGINIGTDITGLVISNVCTKRINDTTSLYDEVKVTIGELYAKAGANLSLDSKDGFDASASAKFGANIAKVETKTGVITEKGKVTVNAGAKAGVEVGGEAKVSTKTSSVKADVGFVSLGFDVSGDNIDKYVFI